ncbi:MAG: hypothetical protein ACI4UV_07170 [Victivallales bacterium]
MLNVISCAEIVPAANTARNKITVPRKDIGSSFFSMNSVKLFLELLRQKSLLIILIKSETSRAFAKKKTIFAFFMLAAAIAAVLAEGQTEQKSGFSFIFLCSAAPGFTPRS